MKLIFLILSFIFSISLVHAQSSSEVDENKIYNIVQESAWPYEGYTEFAEKLSANLNTSKISTKEGVLNIKIQFVIEKDGSFTDIKIKDDEHNLINEVKRVFALLPKWKPAVVDEKNVRSRLTLPLTLYVDTLGLPEISFDDEFKKSLKNFDIDNEYFSFQCNCKLFNKKTSDYNFNVNFDYKSEDEVIFYSFLFIDKSKFKSNYTEDNLVLYFEKQKAQIKEGDFHGKKAKIMTMQELSNGVQVFQKGIILESKEYITLAYVIAPYQDGIDVLFDEFLKSLVIKK